MNEFRSYSEYFELGPQRAYVERNRLCGIAEVSLSRLSCNPPGEHRSPKVPEMLLILCGSGSYGMSYDLGNGWRHACVNPGDLLLAPANVCCRYVTDGDSNFETVSLPTRFVAECMRDLDMSSTGDFGLLHERKFRSASLERQVRTLFSAAKLAKAGDPIFVDQAVVVLLEQLNVLAGHSRRHHRELRLDKIATRKIYQYIESNLQYEISLAELASLAGFSVAHFSRAFKLTVGKSPYAYVLMARIQRAKAILRGSDKPIAEAALECGFSSQAHLTSMFTRFVGTTPARYRKDS